MFNEYSDMLSVDDASKALHIGKNSVYKLVNTNRLGCITHPSTTPNRCSGFWMPCATNNSIR